MEVIIMATDIKLWKDREKRLLDPELFSKKAESLAQKIGEEDPNKSKNKRSQLRRFYDEIIRLNTMAQANKDWNTILPLVHMIVAKTVYAKGRKLVTDSFVEMMKSGIEQIHDKEDLQVFANFLEAFMGFYQIYGPK
jgi:CRISPR-associated protein Csm2